MYVVDELLLLQKCANHDYEVFTAHESYSIYLTKNCPRIHIFRSL